MDNNAKTKTIVGLVIAVFGCLALYGVTHTGEDFKKYGVITAGRITGTGTGRNMIILEYEFYHDGKLEKGSSDFFIRSAGTFINKTFPVIYSSAHPDRNRILILKSDFDSFDMPFPDSLQWTEYYRSKW